MTTIDNISLSLAERDFLVANTPMFLVRKLQANSSIRRIGAEMSSEDILSALRDVAQRKPETLRDEVMPYALLVALFEKRDFNALRSSTLISANWHHRWFDYIRTALIQLFQPTQQFDIPVPGTLPSVAKRNNQIASSFTTVKI
jgi:hypothetical protein